MTHASHDPPYRPLVARRVTVISKRALSTAAFGYVRVSQDTFGSLSIDRQIQNIKETNRRFGLPEPRIFVDDDTHGHGTDRDGFQGLFEAFDENYGAYCTLETGDRAFRSLRSYAEFQDRAAANEIRVFNHQGPIQPEMLPIEATLSVTELKKMRLRGEYKKRELRRQGRLYQGPSHYGYFKRDKMLFPDPERSATIKLIFELAEAHVSPESIVRVLKERGIPSPRGKECWSPTHLRQLLSNPIYAGTTAYWSQPDEEV